MALKMSGTEAIAACYFGDGAAEEGVADPGDQQVGGYPTVAPPERGDGDRDHGRQRRDDAHAAAGKLAVEANNAERAEGPGDGHGN